MSAAGIQRKVNEAQKRKVRLEAERQAIEDRLAFLEGQSKALAFPAHHEGIAGAKAELKKANADALRLQGNLEATDRLIVKVDEKLQGLEGDLRQAEAKKLTADRDRLEETALGKWLEAWELRGQAESAGIEFDGLRGQVEELNARLRGMGRHAPGFAVLSGSDARKKADVLSRLRALGAEVPA